MGVASLRSIESQAAHLLSSPAAARADVGEEGICISEKDAASLRARLKTSALTLVAVTLICIIMEIIVGVLVARRLGQAQPPSPKNENRPLHPS